MEPVDEAPEPVDEEREWWLAGGYSLIVEAPPQRVLSVLLDPKELAAFNTTRRWEIPLQKGVYRVGDGKRVFSRLFVLRWLIDQELTYVGERRLIWRASGSFLVAGEEWSFEPWEEGGTKVTLVYVPSSLVGRFAKLWWKWSAKRYRAREARRRLRALRGRFEL